MYVQYKFAGLVTGLEFDTMATGWYYTICANDFNV